MLKTPDTFVSLIAAQDAADAHNLVFRGDELLVREADLALPGDDALAGAVERWFPVGLLEGRYHRTAWLAKDSPAPEGHVFKKLRALFGAMDDTLLAVAGRAFQISDWARTHRFCGQCATPTVFVDGERCAKCPACGHAAYPRISPAMMVLVKRGDAILLARHTNSPAQFFTALAGFLEAGESIEDAIHREVFEEVGLKVRELRYFGSQPWPFPHSLMIAFTAEYVSGEIRVDANEIAEAHWFGPGDELPKMPPASLSIAGHLIRANLPQARAARSQAS